MARGRAGQTPLPVCIQPTDDAELDHACRQLLVADTLDALLRDISMMAPVTPDETPVTAETRAAEPAGRGPRAWVRRLRRALQGRRGSEAW